MGNSNCINGFRELPVDCPGFSSNKSDNKEIRLQIDVNYNTSTNVDINNNENKGYSDIFDNNKVIPPFYIYTLKINS